MKRLLLLSAALVLSGMTSDAWAQRRGRSGPAMTPYGPVSNPTQSPEWRQAGGNPMIYEQIMMQKMMAAEQKQMQQQYQALQKQQQAYEKWLKEQKAKKDKGQPVDPAYQQLLDAQARYKADAEAYAAKVAARKTKKHSATKTKAKAKAKAKVQAKAAAPATEEKKDGEADAEK
jgi:hypothetical protein